MVVTGDVTAADAAEALGPATEKGDELVLRTQERYLASSGEALLVEGTVVEGGKPRSVLAIVSQREDGVVVRLSPLVEVERTPGVQRFVAWLGRRIHDHKDGLGYGKTNLRELLAGPPAGPPEA